MGKKSKKNRNKKPRDKGIEVDVDPDPTSNEYFYDEVDQFHMDQEKILLSKGAQIRDRSQSMLREEEVLGVASDSSDDDERIEMYESRLKKLRGSVNIDGLGSDLEEDDMEDQKLTKNDDDEESSGLEELDDDQLEEKEALKLQRDLLKEMDDDDFGLVALQKSHLDEGGDVERIGRNLDDMKEGDKLKVLQEESPELMMLIEELKTRMKWNKKMMAKQETLSGMDKLELRLCLDYCVTLNFYLYLKLKREDVTNHPVIERIRFYNEAFKSLSEGRSARPVKSAITAASILQTEDNEEVAEDVKVDEDARRAISKTIEKNRGLTPRRKKVNKNPRVKHRMKFQKALKRRTGQVRPVRREIAKYQGEVSGIRPGIKKGIKFKA